MTLDAMALLRVARRLLERPDRATAGIWPRAVSLLTRQALEQSIDNFWRVRAPGLERCSMRAQLICLPTYLRDETELAKKLSYDWAALSRACHQHSYELPPTSEELNQWIATVERLASYVSEVTRQDANRRKPAAT